MLSQRVTAAKTEERFLDRFVNGLKLPVFTPQILALQAFLFRPRVMDGGATNKSFFTRKHCGLRGWATPGPSE